MKNTHTSVPDIIAHLNPVTEQFGPLSHDSGQMQIPESLQDIPRIARKMLTKAEQDICNSATD